MTTTRRGDRVDAATVHCAPRVVDDFSDDRHPGAVLGTRSTSGSVRRGVDVEGRISIDHGALRLRPLDRPGWGREALVHGPFAREPGLTLAVLALNGHNASQTVHYPETWRAWCRRWVDALRHGRSARRRRHHESLAVGWWPDEAGAPDGPGDAFVMHSVTADNGELWASVGEHPLRAVHGVQNLPILYVVALRAHGACYYVSSVPGAAGLGDHPVLRPVAVDAFDTTTPLLAGVQQRFLGEVGYRVDTRVHHLVVDRLPEWSHWYGTASAADRLVGDGPLAASEADVGGRWASPGPTPTARDAPVPGSFRRGARGATPQHVHAVAVLAPDAPAGLVHALVRPDTHGRAGIVFRVDDGEGWSATVGPDETRLEVSRGGVWETVARSRRSPARPGRVHALQVVDDGRRFGVHLDHQLLFDHWVHDDRHATGRGVGLRAVDGFDGTVACFEAHPRGITLPTVLDPGPPWSAPATEVVVTDAFAGPPGDLADPEPGRLRWRRDTGRGTIVRDGAGTARVVATCAAPNPGRTAYSFDWGHPELADVEVTLRHPPACGHAGHGGRGGIVLAQDDANALVVNLFLDPTFDGSSISTFSRVGGHEDMYDAVWTLVPGVHWHGESTLRVVFDGSRFLALLDGVPSLVRSLTDVYPDAPRLAIRRVGIVANEEWGDDTGSAFTGFVARAPTG